MFLLIWKNCLNRARATPVPVQRGVGPVALEGISFKFENGWISLILDAAVQ